MNWKWSIGRKAALVAAIALSGAAVACSGGGDKDEGASSAPGATAAPAATTKLFIDVDTVRGSTGIPTELRAGKTCVQSSKFPRGGDIFWRVKVLDPRTGKEMDDKILASVQVKLGDGQILDMAYSGKPSAAPVEFIWGALFKIPENYPLGTLDYTVIAKDKEGRTGEWKQLQIASSLVSIVDYEPFTRDAAFDDRVTFAAAP